jgi:hypothetical protein
VTLEVKPVRAERTRPLAGAWKRETDRWTRAGADEMISTMEMGQLMMVTALIAVAALRAVELLRSH